MLKNKIKGIFITLQGETISSKYVSLLCNVKESRVIKIMQKLEDEDFIK